MKTAKYPVYVHQIFIFLFFILYLYKPAYAGDEQAKLVENELQKTEIEKVEIASDISVINGPLLNKKEQSRVKDKNLESAANNKEYQLALKQKIESIEDRLKNVEKLPDVGSEISNLNNNLSKAIEKSSSGIIDWLFQALAIFIGAAVAINVMDQQIRTSWKQLQDNQLYLQKSASKHSLEAWKQLLYNLGVQKELQEERFQWEAWEKLIENQKVQEALNAALKIHIQILLNYTRLAVEKIELVSENVDEAYSSLSSVELPSPPPGLWENLHSYTNVIDDSSKKVIFASLLYDFGRHYNELKKRYVLDSIEAANRSDEKSKREQKQLAIENIRSYKNDLVAYFKEIQTICESQSSC